MSLLSKLGKVATSGIIVIVLIIGYGIAKVTGKMGGQMARQILAKQTTATSIDVGDWRVRSFVDVSVEAPFTFRSAEKTSPSQSHNDRTQNSADPISDVNAFRFIEEFEGTDGKNHIFAHVVRYGLRATSNFDLDSAAKGFISRGSEEIFRQNGRVIDSSTESIEVDGREGRRIRCNVVLQKPMRLDAVIFGNDRQACIVQILYDLEAWPAVANRMFSSIQVLEAEAYNASMKGLIEVQNAGIKLHAKEDPNDKNKHRIDRFEARASRVELTIHFQDAGGTEIETVPLTGYKGAFNPVGIPPGGVGSISASGYRDWLPSTDGSIIPQEPLGLITVPADFKWSFEVTGAH